MAASTAEVREQPALSGWQALWRRYCEYRYESPGVGLSVDVSRVRFPGDFLDSMAGPIASAMDAMARLEAGAKANVDEDRMVGHYWLRAPRLAPRPQLGGEIRNTVNAVGGFARDVRRGAVRGADGPFEHVIHVGIGGSALGPQLICEALEGADARIGIHFLDNADPNGLERLARKLDGRLGRTLVSVVSKSGITPTPRYLEAELRALYDTQGLDFARHAISTSMAGTELDEQARRQRWLARFRLWDWVGGRTSATSAVGLLPLALCGADIDGFLDGAAVMDELTREPEARSNPASLMALMWHWLGRGRGEKRMVVLPYSDRLALLARYVQQLVMESIGKRYDRSGDEVHQGLTVYGNKGSTDQHAYVQQLRDGTPDFFVTFVMVHEDRRKAPGEVEPGVTLGDHLFASLEGTREALYERGRDSLTLTLRELSSRSLGGLIALFERAVGLYAELIDLNPYNQPGVDKHAAAGVIELQREVLAHLSGGGPSETAEQIASAIGRPDRVETIYRLLARLALDPRRGVIAGAGRAVDLRFGAKRKGTEAWTE